MNHPLVFSLALTVGGVGLAACGDPTTPNQPETATALPRAGPLFALASDSWTPRAPVPNAGPRTGLAAGVVPNSAGQPILYVFGGNAGSVQWDDVQAYNYVTNSWTTKGRFPETQFSFGNGVGKIGSKLYFSGGYPEGLAGGSFGSIKNTLYAYDPRTNRVTRKADMPRHTADGITGVINGKLYVLAGTCDDCAQQTVRRLYRYDPATNAWATLPSSPHFHRAGAGAVINGKFYVAGGFDGATGPTTPLDVYDPAANKWKTLAPMPAARVYAGAAALQGKLYIIGGLGPDSYGGGGKPDRECPQFASCGHAGVFAYDPATNQWTRKASLPRGRAHLAAEKVTFEGRPGILAVGGSYQQTDETPSPNELYTP
jgi:N-acetylneuraminic acid mutarotase